MIPGMKNLSYEKRLRRFNLPYLKYRRFRGAMAEVYKIMQNYYDQDTAPTLIKSEGITRTYDLKLYKIRAAGKMRQRQFSLRIIDTWNSLPSQIVNAPSVHSFKDCLDKCWKNRK
ncbi:uncharacterized protein LOC143019036 [Oratosquilla oratoria]|uniref:uncharacterized protein LOC143019036 n=1 Tax=Oratosquilla oratoria TaxID=337810 RepID=UPI003F777C83